MKLFSRSLLTVSILMGLAACSTAEKSPQSGGSQYTTMDSETVNQRDEAATLGSESRMSGGSQEPSESMHRGMMMGPNGGMHSRMQPGMRSGGSSGPMMDMNQMQTMRDQCMRQHSDSQMCNQRLMLKCQEQMSQADCQNRVNRLNQ